MTILLVLHIVAALSGLGYSVYSFFKPSKEALNVVYSLLGLTIVSGTALIFLSRTNMLQTCAEGLAYVAVMLGGIFATKQKLAK